MFDKKVQEMLTEIMFEEKAEKWVKDNLHSTEEDYNKAFIDGAKFGYNEKHSELEIELKWERETKSELADHLGKANDKVADLEKENAELKKMYHESDEDNNKLRENIPILAEAKEIIKTFLAIANNDVEYVQNPQDCKDLWKELCENAKQFITDSEAEK